MKGYSHPDVVQAVHSALNHDSLRKNHQSESADMKHENSGPEFFTNGLRYPSATRRLLDWNALLRTEARVRELRKFFTAPTTELKKKKDRNRDGFSLPGPPHLPCSFPHCIETGEGRNRPPAAPTFRRELRGEIQPPWREKHPPRPPHLRWKPPAGTRTTRGGHRRDPGFIQHEQAREITETRADFEVTFATGCKLNFRAS